MDRIDNIPIGPDDNDDSARVLDTLNSVFDDTPSRKTKKSKKRTSTTKMFYLTFLVALLFNPVTTGFLSKTSYFENSVTNFIARIVVFMLISLYIVST